MANKVLINNNAINVADDGTVSFKMPILTNGKRVPPVIKSSSYTASLFDEIIVFTASATLTLPAATGSGITYRIICRAGSLQILPSGSDTIEGMASQTLDVGENYIISDTASGIWE